MIYKNVAQNVALVTFAKDVDHVNFENRQKWLVKEIRKTGIFKHVIDYTQNNWFKHTDLYKQEAEIFKNNVRGYGYWSWKPHTIQHTFDNYEDVDVVIYIDVNLIIKKLAKMVQKILGKLYENDGIWLHDNGAWQNKAWTKRDAFILMDMDYERYWNSPHVYATYVAFHRNSTVAMDLLKDWCKYSCDMRIIGDDKSKLGTELPELCAHRHDQSILSLLAEKYKVKLDKIGIREFYKKGWAKTCIN